MTDTRIALRSRLEAAASSREPDVLRPPAPGDVWVERAGLVTRGRVSRQRPAHLRAEPIAEATAWLAHYRRFYEESLDRLGEHLSRLQGS